MVNKKDMLKKIPICRWLTISMLQVSGISGSDFIKKTGKLLKSPDQVYGKPCSVQGD